MNSEQRQRRSFLRSRTDHEDRKRQRGLFRPHRRLHRRGGPGAVHAYTVVDAIRDGNVLPFRIDYINTMKEQTINDEQVEGIDTETGLLNQKRISAIVKYMLDHYNQKTRRNISDATYTIKRKDKSGQTVGTAHETNRGCIHSKNPRTGWCKTYLGRHWRLPERTQ